MKKWFNDCPYCDAKYNDKDFVFNEKEKTRQHINCILPKKLRI